MLKAEKIWASRMFPGTSHSVADASRNPVAKNRPNSLRFGILKKSRPPFFALCFSFFKGFRFFKKEPKNPQKTISTIDLGLFGPPPRRVIMPSTCVVHAKPWCWASQMASSKRSHKNISYLFLMPVVMDFFLCFVLLFFFVIFQWFSVFFVLWF